VTNGGLNEDRVRLICLIALCGALSVMQASRFKRLLFNPFALFLNGFVTAKVDIGGCEVFDALVIALMVAMVDEGFVLSLHVLSHICCL